MERLATLARRFGRFHCTFYENKLLLILPDRKNRFEPTPLFATPDHHDALTVMGQDLHIFINLIHTIQLDRMTERQHRTMP